MVKIYQQYKGKGLVMLGVNVAWDNEADARKFIETYKIPYPVGRDSVGDIGRRYQIKGTPTTILVNKDGSLYGRSDGAMTEEEFQRSINALLSQKGK
ncbi:MAG: TlpA family protein disulfide reductase [candidate division NC10 bacterium]|nr:TlpA family protein disulfide reductase [candidate division NC10 bacterium]